MSNGKQRFFVCFPKTAEKAGVTSKEKVCQAYKIITKKT